MSLRIGFLGAGFISQIHTAFLAASDAQHVISAVHDTDRTRAERFAEAHGATVMDQDDVIASCDAVYVTTWTSEHPRLVQAVAAAGTAVFCEKPLAVDAPTAAAMVRTVEDAGVVNQVGLVLRAMSPMRLVPHLLADERAGAPLAVVFRDDQYIPIQGQYGSSWRAEPAKCGRGTLLEHSIHDVDVLRWWLGPVSAVSAGAREYHGFDGIDDVVSARMDFASGATATLLSVWHDILERPSMRHIEVFCERLHVVVEGDFYSPVRWQFTGEEVQTAERSGLLAALEAYGDGPRNPATDFLEAVAAGRPAEPDFAAALPAHQVVDALYRSSDAGGVLVTDPETTRSAR
jgi:predicted dehydrogenase